MDIKEKSSAVILLVIDKVCFIYKTLSYILESECKVAKRNAIMKISTNMKYGILFCKLQFCTNYGRHICSTKLFEGKQSYARITR
jgi:hypothetical protein